jgi:hypothetical protein
MTMNIPPRYRLERLKREEQITMRQCQYAMNKAKYWEGRQRIAVNERFAEMYGTKASEANAKASRLHQKAQQIIRQIVKLEREEN